MDNSTTRLDLELEQLREQGPLFRIVVNDLQGRRRFELLDRDNQLVGWSFTKATLVPLARQFAQAEGR